MPESVPGALRYDQLEAVVEACSDGVIGLDAQARVQIWNKAAARIFGTALASGSQLDSVFADGQRWLDLLERARAGETIADVRLELHSVKWGPTPIQLDVLPRVDCDRHQGYTLIVRDLSEQVFSQQTLAASEGRVRRAEALSRTGTFVVDARDGAAQWSNEMYEIHGVDPMHFSVTRASQLSLVVAEDRAEVARVFDEALSGEVPAGIDVRINRPGAAVAWVHVAIEPRFDSHGDILGFSGVCQDISARIESESALQEALRREQGVTEELRKIDALKDEFLATVSHDLRTPLTSIGGFAGLLRQLVPEQDQLLEPIERNAAEMLHLVQRLLDQARLESGRVILEPTTFRLAIACQDVIARIGNAHGAAEVAIDVPESIAVHMDPNGFGHVLANLVTNAVKYAGDAPIVVSAETAGDMVIVRVADSGHGIAKQYLEHLFDPYFRVPGASSSAKGSGFGLAIVRRYVEMSGGTVWCESPAGGGATFAFTVPVGAESSQIATGEWGP